MGRLHILIDSLKSGRISSVGTALDCSARGRGFDPRAGPALRVLK